MSRAHRFWSALYVRRRWLTVGIGVKRWLVVLFAGAAVSSFGWGHLFVQMSRTGRFSPVVSELLALSSLPVWGRILISISIGGLIMLLAVVKIGKNLVEPLRGAQGAVVDSLYDFRLRDRGPHIVAIGGGTGMPSLLRGLTAYTSNITAIVTVADDGGSSGRLRKELGLLPPGDFRNNLAALARDETLMTQVLQYRFGASVGANGRESAPDQSLGGHAFGNLLLAALTGITGSFDEALLAAQRVLALRGQVLPSTLENVTLKADVALSEETIVEVVGESAIPKAGGRIERVRLDPGAARAYPPALRAIFQADLIVLGPGSLYTSILPNLLIGDLAEALRHCQAKVAYICNLATQPGETDNFSVADHVNAIQRHVPGDFLDVVLANDNFTIPSDTGGGNTQFVPIGSVERVRLVTGNLVDEARPWRHDSKKLARAVLNLPA